MNEDTVVKTVLLGFTLLLSVVGYFLKREVDGMGQRLFRAESDNRRLEGLIQQMQLENLKKWDEIKSLLSDGINGVRRQLADGAVVFEGMRKDIEYIRGTNGNTKD